VKVLSRLLEWGRLRARVRLNVAAGVPTALPRRRPLDDHLDAGRRRRLLPIGADARPAARHRRAGLAA
jgi:hypothetical protein